MRPKCIIEVLALRGIFDIVFVRERRVVGLGEVWLKSLGGIRDSSPSIKNQPVQLLA